jgi:aspartate carbamoyltransferase catalytic subunit
MPKTDILMTTADFKSFETRQPDFGIEVLNLTDRRVSSKKGAATILTIKTKLFLPK